MTASDIRDITAETFEQVVLKNPVPALVLFHKGFTSSTIGRFITRFMQMFAVEFHGKVGLYRMDLHSFFAPKQCGDISPPSVSLFMDGKMVCTVTEQQFKIEITTIHLEREPVSEKRMQESLKQLLGEAVMARLHEAVGAPAVTPRARARQQEPPGPRMSTEQIKAKLIELDGLICQGCDRTFDDPRYLEVDHIVPRADGGIDHISNRVLLCRPCNGIKSDRFTLSGLRRENVRLGRMAGGG